MDQEITVHAIERVVRAVPQLNIGDLLGLGASWLSRQPWRAEVRR